MTPAAQRLQVDRNYDFFQRTLATLLPDHRDEFALIRNQEIVAFFDDVGLAYREGIARFSDHIFSIQEVTDVPVDLGIFSHAGN